MDYNARYYDPALGRFVNADTIVPSQVADTSNGLTPLTVDFHEAQLLITLNAENRGERDVTVGPVNSQALNRYAYVINNPLKYTDPTGHFEEDEIHRYLEHHLGITDPEERQTIINQWKTDTEWWAIISNATYDDMLSGVWLSFTGGIAGEVLFRFDYDSQHNTFSLASSDGKFVSLVKFHADCVDILWMRETAKGWRYQGGTGYAANGAPVQLKHEIYSLGFCATGLGAGIGAVGLLAAPEPFFTKVLAIGAFAGFAAAVYKAVEHQNYCVRSVFAALRLSYYETPY